VRSYRRQGSGFVALLLLTFVILGGAWFYTTWRSGEDVLPPTLSINGMPMGGTTRNQALLAVEQAYTLPITVTYAGEVLPPLLPEIIELRIDQAATAKNLDDVLSSRADAFAFARHVLYTLQGRPPEVTEVSAVVLYSRERVNAYLERTAQKYDREPVEPVALPEAGTFRPSADGTALDKEASLPPLIAAILAAKPTDRQVDLVVDITPAPTTSISMLEQALRAALPNNPGNSGVFAKSLATGQELCINCSVAFRELSTVKIAIALQLYRTHTLPLDAGIASRVDALLKGSNGDATADLLAAIGSGDPLGGAQQVTDLLGRLGLDHAALTDMNGPLQDAESGEPATSALTSPMEAGVLLESTYHCARGGGCLRALDPDGMTPAKCQDLLTRMEQNGNASLLGGNLPVGVRVAHAHSWHGEAHADVALIYGPRADFVLVALIEQPGWLGWEESVPTFANIGLLTYRFFNGDSGALAGTRTQ
jgi:hypothetical protein